MKQNTKAILLFVAGFAVVFGARMLLPGEEPLTVEKIMAEADTEGLFAEIEKSFPEDYAYFTVQAKAILSKPNPQAVDVLDWAHQLPALLNDRYASFYMSAPSKELHVLNAAHLAILDDLKDQPTLCASFVRAGTHEMNTVQSWSLDNALVGQIALAEVRAMAAGRDTPEEHGHVTEESVAEVLHRWSQALEPSDAQIQAVLSGEGADADICEGYRSFSRYLDTADGAEELNMLSMIYTPES